jgi:hypothetical protein
MAGFMGSIENWEILEFQLDAILNRYDIEVFHSKEFHDTKGPFAKWSKIKKRTLVEELFATAHGRIHGYSILTNCYGTSRLLKNLVLERFS